MQLRLTFHFHLLADFRRMVCLSLPFLQRKASVSEETVSVIPLYRSASSYLTGCLRSSRFQRRKCGRSKIDLSCIPHVSFIPVDRDGFRAGAKLNLSHPAKREEIS